MRLSPYFFHRPLLTCGTTNGTQAVCPLYRLKYSGGEHVTLKPEETGIERLAGLPTDLVGAIILSHLLSQQEHTLVPLQLLIHRLVEGIAHSHLANTTREMMKK